MKVNGYRLQHALRELEHSREVAASQFNDNIMQFASATENVLLPDVFARFTALEAKIAKVQTAQTQYNLSVQVTVLGETMPLLQAVKLVGGAGRAEKMWRDTVKGKKNDRYSYGGGDTTRNKDTEYATRAVSVEEAMRHAQHAARVASALREAIQIGNATEVDLDSLDEASLAP